MNLPSSFSKIESPFALFVAYLALKSHFTSDGYNLLKYNGKVAAKESTFDLRKDKYAFQKLLKHKDPVGVLIANMIEDPNIWIGNITSDNAGERPYMLWKKRQESLTYCFSEDLKKIGNIDDALWAGDSQVPELLRMYQAGEISLETVCLLQARLNFIPYWDKNIEPILWKDSKRMIEKYGMLLDFDDEKIGQALARHDEEFA
jgi:hypothetical protein